MNLFIHVSFFTLVNLAIILLGYIFIRKKMVVASWLLLPLSVITIYFIFLPDAATIRMLGLLSIMFTAIKVVVVNATYQDQPAPLSFKQWALFAIGWVGMRVGPFEHLGEAPLPGAWKMIKKGMSRILLGGTFILLAHIVAAWATGNILLYLLTGLFALVGLSFILHFGLLSMSAGAWRLQGVPAYYLFRRPFLSVTLSEFWGKRWNLAFIEMNAVILFRPLKKLISTPVALLLAFLFSGVLHEVVISLPVKAGFGLPTLYFLIQGVGVLIEKQLEACGIGISRNQWVGRLWVGFWLLLPLPLLFHSAFIEQVVFPLTGIKLR